MVLSTKALGFVGAKRARYQLINQCISKHGYRYRNFRCWYFTCDISFIKDILNWAGREHCRHWLWAQCRSFTPRWTQWGWAVRLSQGLLCKPCLGGLCSRGSAAPRYFVTTWESSVALPAYIRIRCLPETGWNSSLFFPFFIFLSFLFYFPCILLLWLAAQVTGTCH